MYKLMATQELSAKFSTMSVKNVNYEKSLMGKKVLLQYGHLKAYKVSFSQVDK